MFSFTPRIRRQFLPEYCSEAVTQRCSENMQQIHRRKPMPKCDFNNFTEIALQHGCSPVHLLHIFRTPFPRNTSGWLLLYIQPWNNCHYFLQFFIKISWGWHQPAQVVWSCSPLNIVTVCFIFFISSSFL